MTQVRKGGMLSKARRTLVFFFAPGHTAQSPQASPLGGFLQVVRHFRKALRLEGGLVAIPKRLFQHLVEGLIEPGRSVPRVTLHCDPVSNVQHQVQFRALHVWHDPRECPKSKLATMNGPRGLHRDVRATIPQQIDVLAQAEASFH